jgi:hypothetical protein
MLKFIRTPIFTPADVMSVSSWASCGRSLTIAV